MFANARVPAPVHALYQSIPAASQATLTALVIIVGTAGQLHDARFGAARASWIDVHSSFGVLLCGAMIAKFFRGLRHVDAESGVDCLVRHLSRQVYTLLYVLFAVKLLASATLALGHSAGVGERLAGPAAASGFFTPEDFQIYVVYGLLALATVRILAAARGPGIAKASPSDTRPPDGRPYVRAH